MSRKKIRVCYTLNTFEIGGAETVALDLARSHDHERFEVEVLSLIEPRTDGEPEMRRRFREAGVKTAVIRQPNFRSPIALWRIFRYLRRGRFDVILGHNRGSDYWGARIGRLAGIPHRYWTRHLVYQDMTAKQLSRYRSEGARVDRVVAVSDAVRRFCLETEQLAPDKVETIVNGIDTEKYRPLSSDETMDVRAELGLEPDEIFLLFVGRFSEQKAPDGFIGLVKALRERGLPVRGYLCGYGPMAAELERTVASDPGGVEILGLRSDIPRLLGACDLFVSTSRNEGLPLNVMEAMSAGAPFVGPAIDQILELVASDEDLAALLYEPPPAKGALSNALIRGWADHVAGRLDDRRGLVATGARGRAVIIDRFSLQRMVRAYEALYLAAAGRGD